MRRRPNFPRQTVIAVCLFFAVLSAATVSGQPRGNRLLPRYVTVQEPDQGEGQAILDEFRGMGLPGDYYLEFALTVLPRRGDGAVLSGQLWGSRNLTGPVSRLSLRDPEGNPAERLLLQNGPAAAAWRFQPGGNGEVEPVGPDTLLDPVADTDISVFDLQMPFLYWPDAVYEGITKLRGRTVHKFLVYPPEDFAAAHPEVGGVRLHLDTAFHALVQAVVLDPDEQPRRKLTVLGFKRLGDQWMVKTIELRNEATRDKVQFEVVGAALAVEFIPALFDPAELTRAPAAPSRVERF